MWVMSSQEVDLTLLLWVGHVGKGPNHQALAYELQPQARLKGGLPVKPYKSNIMVRVVWLFKGIFEQF